MIILLNTIQKIILKKILSNFQLFSLLLLTLPFFSFLFSLNLSSLSKYLNNYFVLLYVFYFYIFISLSIFPLSFYTFYFISLFLSSYLFLYILSCLSLFFSIFSPFFSWKLSFYFFLFFFIFVFLISSDEYSLHKNFWLIWSQIFGQKSLSN